MSVEEVLERLGDVVQLPVEEGELDVLNFAPGVTSTPC